MHGDPLYIYFDIEDVNKDLVVITEYAEMRMVLFYPAMLVSNSIIACSVLGLYLLL